MSDKENFSKFGTHFQSKVIQSLLIDPKFFDRIYDILETEYFDSTPHNLLYKRIKEYFNQYKVPPTIENLEVAILAEKNELLKMQAIEVLKSIRKAAIHDTKFIKDEAIKFCRNQKMKSALYKSIDFWEQGKYDDIYKLIGEALKAGEESNIGHDYWSDYALEHRISLMKRSPLPTGLKHLDEILNGGLSKGELGVIVAGTGLGKSWLLCTLAKNAVEQHFKVVHYTLELYEHQVGLRYDTIFTGIPQENISSMAEVAKKKLKSLNLRDNLIIKEYPPKKASINTLRLHLDKLVQQGFIPDLIVVDYADLLKPSQKYEQRRFELEGIYEELRGIAGELKVPVWTASQSNRSSMDSDLVSLSTIAESFAKAAVSDVIVTLSRKIEDKLKNSGRIFVAKNRAGKDGIVIPITMNLSNYKIETGKPYESLDEFRTDIKNLNTNLSKDLADLNKQKYAEFKELCSTCGHSKTHHKTGSCSVVDNGTKCSCQKFVEKENGNGKIGS